MWRGCLGFVLVSFVYGEVVGGVELLCVECGDEHWLS